jgi:CRP-like cAMP-binding protein
MALSTLKQSVTRLIGPASASSPQETAPTKRRQSQGNSSSRLLPIQHYLIKNTPLFAELSEEEHYIIALCMQLQNCKAGDTLFVKDDPSSVLYLVQQGWVKLYADNTDAVVSTLGPGSLLGETDFLLGRPRTATARASSDVSVWVLNNSALLRILAAQPQIGLGLGLAFGTNIAQFQNHLANSLAKIPLLQNLTDDERRVIARHLSPHRYMPRETIYHSGDLPTGLFFIERGQVWLLGDDHNYIERGPEQIFGERAVISGNPHAYTAQASTEVILWQLSPADYAILADNHPSIKSALNQNLHASLTEALAIASLIVDNEITALQVASGSESNLVKKLQQVTQTLAWLKDSQVVR